MGIPTAATQLHATRTAIQVQSVRKETTSADTNSAMTSRVNVLPSDQCRGPRLFDCKPSQTADAVKRIAGVGGMQFIRFESRQFEHLAAIETTAFNGLGDQHYPGSDCRHVHR